VTVTPVSRGEGTALLAKIALVDPVLRVVTTKLWQASSPRERYIDYLRVSHTIVRASVPLMQRALDACRSDPGDLMCAKLAAFLVDHIAEEREHDVWLLDDLAAAGSDPSAALGSPPMGIVASVVGAQYYWINHFHPVVLLGYIAALEYQRPASGLHEYLRERTQLPAAAFRAVRHHSAVDTDHVEHLARVLDQLPLAPAQVAAIGVNALQTLAGLTDLFTTLAS